MQVKTQKQVMILQSKAQKVADKLNEEVIVIAKGVQHIQVQAGTAYQLNAKDFDAKKSSLIAKKVGDDLEVVLKEGVIIFDNYFAVCATDLSCLVSLPTEDGGLYHIVADASFALEDGTQIVYFYGEQSIVSTESSAVSTNDKQSFLDVVTSNIGVVAAVVVAAVVVASSGNDGGDGDGNNGNDDGDDDNDKNTNTFFIDTGSSNSDGITNNNTITVNNLEAGETWQYSIDSGVNFIDGKGNSFMLSSGTYAANVIQIRKLDAAGVTLGVTKINETSDIVIDTTKSMFISPTIVNIEKDATESEVVYTAVTNENKVTYTLKSGFQKEKFTIDNATGELKYKEKQTQVGIHKVAIIATDVAGNETEKLITVSVKAIGLSTSIAWDRIGDNNRINADEMATATLNGKITVFGIVNSISISSIVFKQNDTVYTIDSGPNLPRVNTDDNTWTLTNSDIWTSQLTQGDYTVTVYLSSMSNGNSITNSNFITTAVDTVKPAEPTFTPIDTGLLSNDGITNNGLITINNLEMGATWQYSISGDNGFVDGTGSNFMLTNNTTYEANTIQIRQIDKAGNVSDIGKNTSRIIVDNTNPMFDQQPTTIDAYANSPIETIVYDAQVVNLNGGTADEGITYRIKGTNASKFSITTNTGVLTYKAIQTLAHDNDTVIIVATDVAGNEAEKLITVSVKVVSLSTSVVWNGIGGDNKINASEIATTALSGTVEIIGVVTSISISSIVFKRGDTLVHTIDSSLPTINANNTWALNNNDTWTSQLTQGDYTVTVNLSANGGGVTSVNSITAAVDITKPVQPTFDFVDTGLLDSDGITGNNVITVDNLEEGITWQYSTSGDTGFTNGTGNSFTLTDATYEANAIQVRQIDEVGNISNISKNTSRIVVDTIDPIFDQQPTTIDAYVNAPISIIVYDSQVTNLNGGTVDEGIAYNIKGANTDKFSITADTGRLTYKAIQTTVHDNDTVIVVATDIAGNKAEQLISILVKENLARGFVINGENADDKSGHSVSTAGDVNGDGLDDLIVGAFRASPSSKFNAGKSYVVFGKADNTAINLSAITSGTGGFVINGENAGDFSGSSVSNAGDVNGDGLDDLIVGAYKADPSGKSNAGKSYVIFGKANNTAINLSAIGTGGFVINGENEMEWSGYSASTAGDVNGDGLDDLIVGAFQANLNGTYSVGKSYVIFGKADNTAINLSAIASGTGGFIINGENFIDNSGYSVSTAGDVNGDGLDDLIIGAPNANLSGRIDAGKSYVVFGKADNTAINLSAIASGTGGFVIIGEFTDNNSGFSVSSAGDVNGDGLDDLIVGAPYSHLRTGEKAGRSYVVFGKKDNTVVDLYAIAQGTGGFAINGENKIDFSGSSVSNAGDVNGDGLDDLIVSAYRADLSGKSNAGKSYVIFGKTDSTAINLSAIASGTGGFVIIGENTNDYNGYSTSTAGDVNGDGLDDLIVGAPYANLSGRIDAGKSYVVFGKTDTNAIDLTKPNSDSKYAIDHLGNGGADVFIGTSSDEIFVAGAGNDTLIGNGGMDVFSAGAGNDTIAINASNIVALQRTGAGNRARVDGGGNIDTLKLNGSGSTLDLTKIINTRIQDIEKIDITGPGSNTLILNLSDVLDASTSTNILKVLGNDVDSVNASGFAKISGVETEGSITYDVYTHSGANTDANAALWIQQGAGVVL